VGFRVYTYLRGPPVLQPCSIHEVIEPTGDGSCLPAARGKNGGRKHELSPTPGSNRGRRWRRWTDQIGCRHWYTARRRTWRHHTRFAHRRAREGSACRPSTHKKIPAKKAVSTV